MSYVHEAAVDLEHIDQIAPLAYDPNFKYWAGVLLDSVLEPSAAVELRDAAWRQVLEAHPDNQAIREPKAKELAFAIAEVAYAEREL